LAVVSGVIAGIPKIIMVMADIENPVFFQPLGLMDLEIEANCGHG
jgi:hypothetical protein